MGEETELALTCCGEQLAGNGWAVRSSRGIKHKRSDIFTLSSLRESNSQ